MVNVTYFAMIFLAGMTLAGFLVVVLVGILAINVLRRRLLLFDLGERRYLRSVYESRANRKFKRRKLLQHAAQGKPIKMHKNKYPVKTG